MASVASVVTVEYRATQESAASVVIQGQAEYLDLADTQALVVGVEFLDLVVIADLADTRALVDILVIQASVVIVEYLATQEFLDLVVTQALALLDLADTAV